MALPTSIVNPTIFREYIGSKSYPGNLRDFPADIINSEIKEFHFIVAFAAEKYDEKSGILKGTGEFYKNWIVPNINGEMIWRLKDTYKNVKVVISIGGRGPKYPFNPDNKDKWAENAGNSLAKIINALNDEAGNIVIDGIDINYDTIKPSDEYVFDRCIGSLIDSLKNVRHLVSVVSIAPSHSVQPHYRALYQHKENDIDWVNYQFYTHKITSVDEFTNLYRQLANETYTRHNLLVGFSTDQADDGNLPLGVFYKACEDLIKSGVLPGIFIWNANDSQVEQIAQKLFTQK